jgi:hypothetical protein
MQSFTLFIKVDFERQKIILDLLVQNGSWKAVSTLSLELLQKKYVNFIPAQMIGVSIKKF